jgi:hypothetical protein
MDNLEAVKMICQTVLYSVFYVCVAYTITHIQVGEKFKDKGK